MIAPIAAPTMMVRHDSPSMLTATVPAPAPLMPIIRLSRSPAGLPQDEGRYERRAGKGEDGQPERWVAHRGSDRPQHDTSGDERCEQEPRASGGLAVDPSRRVVDGSYQSNSTSAKNAASAATSTGTAGKWQLASLQQDSSTREPIHVAAMPVTTTPPANHRRARGEVWERPGSIPPSRSRRTSRVPPSTHRAAEGDLLELEPVHRWPEQNAQGDPTDPAGRVRRPEAASRMRRCLPRPWPPTR